MFLELSHTKLEVYSFTKKLSIACYKVLSSFPIDEKYILTQQIKRAALSVHLNVAEGASRKSNVEKKRYFEISRSSLVEIDAALDVAEALGYCNKKELSFLGEVIISTFKMLTDLINSTTR